MIAEVAPAGQQGARIDQRQAVGGTVTEPFKRQSRTLAQVTVGPLDSSLSGPGMGRCHVSGTQRPRATGIPAVRDYSESELATAQEEAGVAFPPRTCELLMETLPPLRGGVPGLAVADRARRWMSGGLTSLTGSISTCCPTSSPPRVSGRPAEQVQQNRARSSRSASPSAGPDSICAHRAISNERLEAGNRCFDLPDRHRHPWRQPRG